MILGHRPRTRAFAACLLLVDALLLVVFHMYPKELIGRADARSYVAAANNIASEARFHSSMGQRDLPLGQSLVLAPACLVRSAHWRGMTMFVTLLLLVNIAVVACFAMMRRIDTGWGAVALPIAVMLMPGMISQLLLDVMTETFFTVLLVLAFVAAHHALETEKPAHWFALGCICGFASSVRLIGLGLSLALAVMTGLHVVLAERRSIRVSPYAVAGLCLGLLPFALKSFGFLGHASPCPAMGYEETSEAYIEALRRIGSDLSGVSLFLAAVWRQLVQLVILSLGSVIVFLRNYLAA